MGFLRDIIENNKSVLAMLKEVDQTQKNCYQEIIKCKEDSIEQDKLITALATEVINLKERVKKLECENVNR